MLQVWVVVVTVADVESGVVVVVVGIVVMVVVVMGVVVMVAVVMGVVVMGTVVMVVVVMGVVVMEVVVRGVVVEGFEVVDGGQWTGSVQGRSSQFTSC